MPNPYEAVCNPSFRAISINFSFEMKMLLYLFLESAGNSVSTIMFPKLSNTILEQQYRIAEQVSLKTYLKSYYGATHLYCFTCGSACTNCL